MAIMTGVGLMLGAYGAVDTYLQGNAMRKDALQGLEEFQAQQLTNAYAGLSPSLEAERTALDTFSESQAGIVDVSQGMDASDAMAMLSMGNEQVQRGRLDQLNQMRKEEANYDILRAQDDVAIRNMEEARDQFELSTLQAQLYAGNQMRSDALMGGAKMMVGAGNAFEDRRAGLGIDPMAYRKEAIQRGEGTLGQYLMEGKPRGFFKQQKANRAAAQSVSAQSASTIPVPEFNLQPDVASPGINLLNPDGSLRFNLLEPTNR